MDDDDDEPPQLVSEFATSSRPSIPVTILTGFLGSGKSTLLNFLLTEYHGKRIAIVENEFSAGLGIEGMIAKSGVSGEPIIVELNNGCICCSVKGDLVLALEKMLLEKGDKFDYVIIEATGLANPGPIISTFWADDYLDGSLMLDGVVCVVDSLNFLTYIGSPDISFDIGAQISYADRILLNKSDLVSTDVMNCVEKAVMEINATAPLLRTKFARVDPAWVLGLGEYSHALGDTASTAPGASVSHGLNLLDSLLCAPCKPLISAPTPSTSAQRNKAASVLSTESFQFPGLVDLTLLRRCLDAMLYRQSSDPPSSSSSSHTIDYDHEDKKSGGNSKMTTAAIRATDAIFSLQDNMEIYRMKGAFHTSSQSQSPVYILQAVHDLFDLRALPYTSGSSQDKTNGINCVVVIGKCLERQELWSRFMKCVASSTILMTAD